MIIINRAASLVNSTVFDSFKNQQANNIKIINSTIRNTSTTNVVVIALSLAAIAFAVFKVLQSRKNKTPKPSHTPL